MKKLVLLLALYGAAFALMGQVVVNPPTPPVTSANLDSLFGTVRGSIIERGSAIWSSITPGTSGLPFVSNGSGADPGYQALTAAGIATATITSSNIAAATITSSNIAANTIANSNIAFMGPATIKCNLSSSSGAPQDCVQNSLAPVSVFNYLSAAQIADVQTFSCTLDISTPINNLLSSGVYTIYMPPGTYCIGSPLIINGFQNIIGAGHGATFIRSLGGQACTALIQTINFSSLFGTGSVAGPRQFGIYNLYLDGNKSNVTGTCNNVNIYGYDYKIDHVKSFSATGDCFFSQWGLSPTVPVAAGGDTMAAKIHDFATGLCLGSGIDFQGPHDTWMSDIESFSNSGVGINCQSNTNFLCDIQLSNGHIYGNASGGIFVHGVTTVGSEMTMSNVISETNQVGGIDVDSFSFIVGSNLWMFSQTSGGYGLAIAGSSSNIAGALISGNGGNGVLITGGSNLLSGIQTRNNTGTGISISGSSNTLVGAVSTGNGTNYSIGGGNNTSGNF